MICGREFIIMHPSPHVGIFSVHGFLKLRLIFMLENIEWFL